MKKIRKMFRFTVVFAFIVLAAYGPSGKSFTIDPNHINIPGKMCVSGDLLAVNDLYTGIHLIDISDPAHPQRIHFISISDNVDVAIESNALYADSDGNLLVYDINDPAHPVLTNVLTNSVGFNCTQYVYADNDYYSGPSCMCSVPEEPASTGVGAQSTFECNNSFTRFAVINNILYVLKTGSVIKAYSLSSPVHPTLLAQASLPLPNAQKLHFSSGKLFVGTQDGMIIYNISNPTNPVFLAQQSSVNCSVPMVITSNIAYFALQNASDWPNNRLEVKDVSSLTNFRTLFKIPLYSPSDLSMSGDNLYVADGYDGVKRFGVSNLNSGDISNGMVNYPKALSAYASGVLVHSNLLVVSGNNVMIYTLTNNGQPELLSTVY